MKALLHALNIGTLATWLSVAGFGTIGAIFPSWKSNPSPIVEKLETVRVDPDLNLSDETISDPAPAASGPSSPDTLKTLPAPPEIPDIADTQPLPEIPDLAPSPQPVETRKPAPSPSPRPAARAIPQSSSGRKTSAASSENPALSGTPGNGKSSTGMSKNDRIAAGHMPAPSYPAEARRKKQTGTIIVRFAVDSNGRVTAAVAKNPSPWPMLNQEAIRTVLRWKFPPGDFITIERPIVFIIK